jgi:hypothetical protein
MIFEAAARSPFDILDSQMAIAGACKRMLTTSPIRFANRLGVAPPSTGLRADGSVEAIRGAGPSVSTGEERNSESDFSFNISTSSFIY